MIVFRFPIDKTVNGMSCLFFVFLTWNEKTKNEWTVYTRTWQLPQASKSLTLKPQMGATYFPWSQPLGINYPAGWCHVT